MGKALARKKSSAKRSTATRVRRRTAPRERSRSGIHNYRAALNFLNSQTNYEKMLRVGYNHTNFNLSRMLKILCCHGRVFVERVRDGFAPRPASCC